MAARRQDAHLQIHTQARTHYAHIGHHTSKTNFQIKLCKLHTHAHTLAEIQGRRVWNNSHPHTQKRQEPPNTAGNAMTKYTEHQMNLVSTRAQ